MAAEMIDRGAGPAVVLVPGIQGRWEWMEPAVEALSRRCRVLTYSLSGEPGTRAPDPPEPGLSRYVSQLDDIARQACLERFVLCGVSFGGLIGAHYAAARPDRVEGLVLVSTPGPSWRPGCHIERYLRMPRLMAPIFVAGSPARLWPEVVAAHPGWRSRIGFGLGHLARVLSAPMSPTRMADRVRTMLSADTRGICRAIDLPTLVVTGEPALDRVVPTSSSEEYVTLIRHARATVLRRSGHIGLVTRPDAFAAIVAGFASQLIPDAAPRASATY